ncbi:MAG TPA: hypothetical protein PKO06_06750, partial [Candidatus Ozemobacteraceae bacterium]|nr:hypothetical protein [Candidatus Ozemobacteraceae bacterium]
VFGEVLAGVINARIYVWEPLKQSPWSLSKDWTTLNLYGELAPFITDMMAANGRLVPLEQAAMITRSIESLRTYNQEFASLPKRRPYNLAYAQMIDQRQSEPWSGFASADPLYAFFDRNAPEASRHAIPAPFNDCVPGAHSLRDLGAFLSACRDIGRTAYTIEVESADQLWPELARRGLPWRDTLTLSGFVLVRSRDKRLILDRDLRYLGNGGLLLEEGDIEIRAPLRPISETRRHHVLQVVALNGDIRLATGREALIQAHLLASGRLTFAGSEPVRVRGGIAAGRLFDRPEEAETFPGGSLEYLPEMAAFPRGGESSVDTPDEKSLLSFSFEPAPVIHD